MTRTEYENIIKDAHLSGKLDLDSNNLELEWKDAVLMIASKVVKEHPEIKFFLATERVRDIYSRLSKDIYRGSVNFKK